MEIFVYSDESGTFDCHTGQYFVYGGIVYLSSEAMQDSARRYQAVENQIRQQNDVLQSSELKASILLYKEANRLFKVTNREYRFGVVIEIPRLRIREQIADDKKARQRYIDYAYKIAVKRFFKELIRNGAIDPQAVKTVHFFVDQHTTATSGIYELREGLEQELIHGTYNFESQAFFLRFSRLLQLLP